jgi:hypothetical protein
MDDSGGKSNSSFFLLLKSALAAKCTMVVSMALLPYGPLRCFILANYP